VNNRRAAALLLVSALLLGLAACGPAPEPEPAPTTVPAPTTAPPTTVTPAPEITESAAPKGPIQTVDTSLLSGNGLSIQQLFVCDDDTVLFFVSPVGAGGTLSENILAYSYSCALMGFRPVSRALGVVSLYPDQVMDDGRVCLVTLSSESYLPDALCYLDPVTLAVESAPLPPDDFYDLRLSPDGRYAAITTYDALRITDMSYATEYARFERQEVEFIEEGEEPYIYDVLPQTAGWLPGSEALSFTWVSLDEDCAAGVIDTETWSLSLLDTPPNSTVLPLGPGRMIYHEAYARLPAGIVMDGLALPAIEMDMAEGALIASITGHPAGHLCLPVFSDSGRSLHVVDGLTGQPLAVFDGGMAGLTFYQALFTPTAGRLVVLARPLAGGPRQVLTWDYLA